MNNMANVFIVTGQGFVKSSTFDMETKTPHAEFTQKIREAGRFTAKSALGFIKNHNIEGFLWNPFAEEAVRDMYKVVKRSEFNILEGEKNSTQEYYVQKAKMVSNSDVGFLFSGKLQEEDLLTFEEAKAKAIELNTKMFVELGNKIRVQEELSSDKLWKQE
jgi:hypothetical protein